MSVKQNSSAPANRGYTVTIIVVLIIAVLLGILVCVWSARTMPEPEAPFHQRTAAVHSLIL